jgi:hypothetical protein
MIWCVHVGELRSKKNWQPVDGHCVIVFGDVTCRNLYVDAGETLLIAGKLAVRNRRITHAHR